MTLRLSASNDAEGIAASKWKELHKKCLAENEALTYVLPNGTELALVAMQFADCGKQPSELLSTSCS